MQVGRDDDGDIDEGSDDGDVDEGLELLGCELLGTPEGHELLGVDDDGFTVGIDEDGIDDGVSGITDIEYVIVTCKLLSLLDRYHKVVCADTDSPKLKMSPFLSE